MFKKMIENRYKKRYEAQTKIVTRQREEIESLKLKNEELERECEKKDELISSIEPMRSELKELIDELKEMKTIANKKLYKGRWKIIRFLIRL